MAQRLLSQHEDKETGGMLNSQKVIKLSRESESRIDMIAAEKDLEELKSLLMTKSVDKSPIKEMLMVLGLKLNVNNH
jgi:hypothetical protein